MIIIIFLYKEEESNIKYLTQSSKRTTFLVCYIITLCTCWMPPASDGLVSVGGYNHTGQGPGEIALEVCQDNIIVVAGREEIVGTGGEPHTPHITGVDLELLD